MTYWQLDPYKEISVESGTRGGFIRKRGLPNGNHCIPPRTIKVGLGVTATFFACATQLTHWCRVTHICVTKITIIGSDNGLSPDRRQPIIWTNAGILLTGPLGTNFNEILIWIQTFSFKKMHLKVPSAKWRPFCLGRNVLKPGQWVQHYAMRKPRQSHALITHSELPQATL